MHRIGLISDTHGLLRPEALQFLRGCERILHAGDIGAPAILDALAELAPLDVVRGNNDDGDWARAIAETLTIEIGDVRVHMLHEIARLAIDSRASGVRVVVSGHSHRPRFHEQDGVLFVNPGSAGPRRFRLPVSIGELRIGARGRVTARLHELTPSR